MTRVVLYGSLNQYSKVIKLSIVLSLIREALLIRDCFENRLTGIPSGSDL